MKSGLAGSLDEVFVPLASQKRMQILRDGDCIGKRGLAGVKIEQDEIGPIELSDARKPDVERQRPLIDEIEQGLEVIDQHVTYGLALLGGEFGAGDPVRVVRRSIFLPEMRSTAVLTEAIR